MGLRVWYRGMYTESMTQTTTTAPLYVDAHAMAALHNNAAVNGPEVASAFHRDRSYFWSAVAGQQHLAYHHELLVARCAEFI